MVLCPERCIAGIVLRNVAGTPLPGNSFNTSCFSTCGCSTTTVQEALDRRTRCRFRRLHKAVNALGERRVSYIVPVFRWTAYREDFHVAVYAFQVTRTVNRPCENMVTGTTRVYATKQTIPSRCSANYLSLARFGKPGCFRWAKRLRACGGGIFIGRPGACPFSASLFLDAGLLV